MIKSSNTRLSLQYNHERAEMCHVVKGLACIVKFYSVSEGELEILRVGETVTFMQGRRRFLVGLNLYLFIAEIWQRRNVISPSDEGDIVRLLEVFGR